MGFKQKLLNLLVHPDVSQQSKDSLQAVQNSWQIIRQKPFLQEIYREWYANLADSIPPGKGMVLEIGSGAGFMQEQIEDLVRSDILPLPDVQKVDACASLPFADEHFRAIAMVNTFHHLKDCEMFLHEASRCLKPGGAIVMLEPWPTLWSRFIFTQLHAEPFDINAEKWQLDGYGPLTTANGALPWLVLVRDKKRFQSLFPSLRIEKIELTMPLRYILSGGVSMRNLVPDSTFTFWKNYEQILRPLIGYTAMFAYIVIRKGN